MSLMPRCSSPHLCTPTQRTEGGSGVGVAVGDIPAVAVATGVAEETAVCAARSSPDENCKGSAMKAGRTSRDRVREHCFMLPVFSLCQICDSRPVRLTKRFIAFTQSCGLVILFRLHHFCQCSLECACDSLKQS